MRTIEPHLGGAREIIMQVNKVNLPMYNLLIKYLKLAVIARLKQI